MPNQAHHVTKDRMNPWKTLPNVYLAISPKTFSRHSYDGCESGVKQNFGFFWKNKHF